MKTRILPALAVAAVVGSAAVAAQTTAPAGTISRADYLAKAGARFDQLDINRDGTLTRDERRGGKAARQAMRSSSAAQTAPGAMPSPRGSGLGMRGRMMEGADSDRDGRISRAEYDALAAQRFTRMDASGNGMIEPAELPGNNGGRAAARMDADGNGSVSRAEYDAQVGERFARVDGNDDGFIDQAEAAAGRPRGGERRMRAPQPSPNPDN